MRRTASYVNYNEDDIVILLPDLQILRLIARSMLLAALIISFPWLSAMLVINIPMQKDSALNQEPESPKWVDGPSMLPKLVSDLKKEGLFNAELNNLFLGDPGTRGAYLKGNGIGVVDTECEKGMVADDCVDFVMAVDGIGECGFGFVDRVLKVGGIVAVRLVENEGRLFRLPGNYRMVYIRRFGATVVGIKKISRADVPDVKGGLIGRKLLSGGKFDGEVHISDMKLKRTVKCMQEFVMKIMYGNVGEFRSGVGGRKLFSVEPCMNDSKLKRVKKMRMYVRRFVPAIVDIEIILDGNVGGFNGFLVVELVDGSHMNGVKQKQVKKVTMHMQRFVPTILTLKKRVFKGSKSLLFATFEDDTANELMEKRLEEIAISIPNVPRDDDTLHEFCIEIDYTRKNGKFMGMNVKERVFKVMEKVKKERILHNLMDEVG